MDKSSFSCYPYGHSLLWVLEETPRRAWKENVRVSKIEDNGIVERKPSLTELQQAYQGKKMCFAGMDFGHSGNIRRISQSVILYKACDISQ